QGKDYCVCEDFGGIARNNIVVGTSDAALHTKLGCRSQFQNNIVYDASVAMQVQIDSGMPIELDNNVLSGSISTAAVQKNNPVKLAKADFAKLSPNPAALDFSEGSDPGAIKGKGPVLPTVTDDYCGSPRKNTNDWGAIQFPACKIWPWTSTRRVDAPPSTA